MLSDDLARVEEHGFLRDTFPITYHEHRLDILDNDAYEKPHGRLYLHFTVYCEHCDYYHTIRGALPRNCDNSGETIARAKMAAIGKFKYVDCL